MTTEKKPTLSDLAQHVKDNLETEAAYIFTGEQIPELEDNTLLCLPYKNINGFTRGETIVLNRDDPFEQLFITIAIAIGVKGNCLPVVYNYGSDTSTVYGLSYKINDKPAQIILLGKSDVLSFS